MKKLSKVLSLFVALCMLMSMGAFASGEPSGAPSGEAPAAAASAPAAPATKTTADVSGMKASDYAYITNYSNRDDTGNIYIGNDVTASDEIALDETVTGPGYTAVYAHGDKADVKVTGTLVATDDTDGKLASDFSGCGTAVVAYDGAKINIEDATIFTKGFDRSAIIISEKASVMVKNSELTVLGANPITESWDGYHSSADQNWMISPPWCLGLYGGARVVNMIGTTPTLSVVDSTLTAGGWAVLSTDAGSNMVINVVDSELNVLPESQGGMDSGWRIFGYDEDAYGSGYGAYYIGNPSQYYYGATFNGVTYAAIITGAQTAHYASSNGNIELSDASGEPIETVKGKGQPTVINGVFAIMQHNSVSDGIWIEDGTIVNTEDAIVIWKTANGDYYFDNAELNSAKGVLFQMIDNDDDSRIGGNPMSVETGFDSVYSESKLASAEPGFPGITYDYESGTGGNNVTATYTNGEYTGNIYNGTGYYNQNGDNLTVTLGENAVLNGDIALTSTVKGVKYSPEAIEGIEYYGDDIAYTLLDAEGNITKDESKAEYIHITDYTINQYFLQGHVENMVHYNGASTIAVVVEKGAEWNVAGESLLTSLSIANGATVKGKLTENADGTLTLTASKDTIPAGEYGGSNAAVGGGVNVGGGVTDDGTLDIGAATIDNAGGAGAGAASGEASSAKPMANDNAATAVLIATSLSAEASGEPSEDKNETVIVIGGKQYILEVHVIDGEEYVKLSDLASLFSDDAEGGDVTWADYQEYLIEAAGKNAPNLDEFKAQVYAMNSWDDVDLNSSPWDQLFTTVGISTWAEFQAAGGNGAASAVEGSMG